MFCQSSLLYKRHPVLCALDLETCNSPQIAKCYFVAVKRTGCQCKLGRVQIHSLKPLLQCTTLHYTTLHYTTLHYTTLHYTTLHYTTLHYTTLHCTTLHYTTLHYTTLQCTTLHYTTLNYTLHDTTPRNNELINAKGLGLQLKSISYH